VCTVPSYTPYLPTKHTWSFLLHFLFVSCPMSLPKHSCSAFRGKNLKGPAESLLLSGMSLRPSPTPSDNGVRIVLQFPLFSPPPSPSHLPSFPPSFLHSFLPTFLISSLPPSLSSPLPLSQGTPCLVYAYNLDIVNNLKQRIPSVVLPWIL
jgi:hypothetical protein